MEVLRVRKDYYYLAVSRSKNDYTLVVLIIAVIIFFNTILFVHVTH